MGGAGAVSRVQARGEWREDVSVARARVAASEEARGVTREAREGRVVVVVVRR